MRLYVSVFILTFLLLQSSCRLVDNTIKRRGISSENPTDSTPAPTPSDPAALLKQWKATLPVAFSSAVTLESTASAQPQVAINSLGNAIVVWEQSDGSKKQIFKSEYKSGAWTHPSSLIDNISPEGQDAQKPQVELNDNGEAIIVWMQSDGSYLRVFKSDYRSGSWTHPSGLSDNLLSDGGGAYAINVDMNNSGDTIIVWNQDDMAVTQNVYKSEYRSGAWTHPVDQNDYISPSFKDCFIPKVSMNDSGEAIIVWSQYDSTNKLQVFKSEYRSGAWTHPANLADNISPDGQHAQSQNVAFNSSGEAIIVWYEYDGSFNQIFKSEYRSGSWTHPANLADNISPNGSSATTPEVSLNDSGDALIAWKQFDGSTKSQVFKSEYRSGAWTHPSGLSDNISPDGQNVSNTLSLDLNSSGEAIIVWQQNDGAQDQVFKSEYRSGAWTHPSGLSDNISPNGFNSYLPKVDLNDSGEAVISWYQLNSAGNSQIFMSHYHSAAWTHPSGISDHISPQNQQTSSLSTPQLAVNSSGDAVIVWIQNDGSSDQVFKSEFRSGSWTHPTNLSDSISPSGQTAEYPQVDINESGDTLIVWDQSDGTNSQIFKSEYRSGAWTHPSGLTDNISPDGQPAGIAKGILNDSGEALIAWIQIDGLRYQVFKSEYRSGAWTHPSGLTDNISPDGQHTLFPDVDMNSSGEAIIVWQQSDGTYTQIFKSEYRSGAWTIPSSLSDNISPNGKSASNPLVQINSSGETLIVWKQFDSTNNAQTFKSEYRSGSWSHPSGLTDNISPDGQNTSAPQMALNDSGNAMIVWQQSNGTNETFFKSEYSSGSWTHPTSLSDHMLLGTQTATDVRVSLNNTNQAIITWKDGSNRILSTDNFSGSWVNPYYVKSTTTPYLHYQFVQNKNSEKGVLLFSEKSGDTKKNGIQLYEFKQ